MLDDKESEEKVVEGKVAPNPEIDKFWIDYGRKAISDTVDKLDERAKFMITTCASLVVINFGLLVAFNLEGIVFIVTPQFFLVISSACFVISYFPISKKFNPLSPELIEEAYNSWKDWKLIWHYIGFGFFVTGLLAFAITSLLK